MKSSDLLFDNNNILEVSGCHRHAEWMVFRGKVNAYIKYANALTTSYSITINIITHLLLILLRINHKVYSQPVIH